MIVAPLAVAIGGGVAATTMSTIIAGAIVGAAVGAVSAAITGGDIAKGALLGGLMGGIGGAMMGPAAASTSGAVSAGAGATGQVGGAVGAFGGPEALAINQAAGITAPIAQAGTGIANTVAKSVPKKGLLDSIFGDGPMDKKSTMMLEGVKGLAGAFSSDEGEALAEAKLAEAQLEDAREKSAAQGPGRIQLAKANIIDNRNVQPTAREEYADDMRRLTAMVETPKVVAPRVSAPVAPTVTAPTVGGVLEWA